MISLLLSLLLSFVSVPAEAAAPCGVFEVRGIVRREGMDARLVSAEKSRSEAVFTVRAPESFKLLAYENIAVRAEVVLTRPMDGMAGAPDAVRAVEMRVPDPLFPARDSGYRVQEARACRPRTP